jgi:hypothetical protein
MMRAMRRALVILALVVLAPATASAAPHDRPPTALRVIADADGDGPEAARSIRVRCSSSGDRSRACRILRRLAPGALGPPPRQEICTQQWGGPQTARIVGRLRGRQVDRRFDRHDGCAIFLWDRVAPLIELTGVPVGGPHAP